VEHPDPRSGPGCTPSRRGYRAVTPPVTYGAEANAAAQPKRGDNRRAATGGPTGPASKAGQVSAIAPAMPTRRRSRLGWSAAEGERGQAETA
jgi:hypothetical protein